MKRGLEGLLKIQDYARVKKRVGIALIILIIALILFAGYFLFFYIGDCSSSTCFVDSMNSCRKITWFRGDDTQANWKYRIVGNAAGDACKVEVTLLQMKEGTIDSSLLEGKSMTCTVQKGDTQFPEKDISKCTGLLKEEMQNIIIQRMHNYLLKNVGEIKQEFGGV